MLEKDYVLLLAVCVGTGTSQLPVTFQTCANLLTIALTTILIGALLAIT
jgi:hypothetical protein